MKSCRIVFADMNLLLYTSLLSCALFSKAILSLKVDSNDTCPAIPLRTTEGWIYTQFVAEEASSFVTRDRLICHPDSATPVTPEQYHSMTDEQKFNVLMETMLSQPGQIPSNNGSDDIFDRNYEEMFREWYHIFMVEEGLAQSDPLYPRLQKIMRALQRKGQLSEEFLKPFFVLAFELGQSDM
jgi:hypothetical protein